jgi:pyruvate dehydrogenase E2 component (dihydrolipoamide acetyltransferase)
VQRLIARRMVESKTTTPDFTLEVDVEMERAVALRASLKEASSLDERPPTLNDLVIAASARALREYPTANGCFRDGQLELHERVNVGFAVAEADTLLVPTIFDADQLSLDEIGRASRDLVERIGRRKVTPLELAGGTFTVSNLGMFGISSFTAVINPPQAAILAVGAVRTTPVVRGEEIAVGRRMALTLVCDHRVLYGAPAARFLMHIKALLEAPDQLIQARSAHGDDTAAQRVT